MKKLVFMLMLAVGATYAAHPVTNGKPAMVVNSSLKIVNDTDNEIRIHTGSGVVSLNANGGSTSITCSAGTKIYTAPNGSKKDFLFEVTDDMCGTTVKLSKYL